MNSDDDDDDDEKEVEEEEEEEEGYVGGHLQEPAIGECRVKRTVSLCQHL